MPCFRVLLVLSTVSLAACGHDAASTSRAKTPRQVARAQAPDEETSSAPAVTDERIEESVRAELEADPAVDAERVRIDVDEGVVELGGVVPHLLMVDAAIERAEMVHGVRAVVDRMEVPRDGRPDGVVLTRVQEALRAEPALEIVAPSVRVIDGVVTLRGVVSSDAMRQLAERIASSVRGARDVVSQLEIRAEGRSDAEIRSDVQRALRIDRWVDEWLLDVEVDEGVVAIEGVQPTAAAKRRAIAAAWVSGVRDVDATLVDVDPSLPPERRRPPPGYTYPNDDEIRSAITTTLQRDPRLRSSSGLEVEVREGIARLRGGVATLDARRRATELAESVHGVWRVENELTLRRPELVNDAELGQQVERALERAAAIDDEAVTATVHRGAVTLTGSVESPYSRVVAEEVIARIPGVRELDNQLEGPARPSAPPPDDVLLQNVIAHLEAHPYVDRGEIEVSVSHGEVMLRGRVTDWRAEREALRAAHEAGATSVLDDIDVVEGPS
jgi:osmotically-inducible protein OsmY